MSDYSFKRGYDQVQRKDLEAVRQDIMAVLNLKTNAAFLQRLKGRVEPKVGEAAAIEKIFKEKGITKIWGK